MFLTQAWRYIKGKVLLTFISNFLSFFLSRKPLLPFCHHLSPLSLTHTHSVSYPNLFSFPFIFISSFFLSLAIWGTKTPGFAATERHVDCWDSGYVAGSALHGWGAATSSWYELTVAPRQQLLLSDRKFLHLKCTLEFPLLQLCISLYFERTTWLNNCVRKIHLINNIAKLAINQATALLFNKVSGTSLMYLKRTGG